MQHTSETEEKKVTVNVIHDLKRQLLEIPSLFRVINKYYDKKRDVQKQIKPLILKRLKEGLKTLKNKRDWLHTIPIALTTLSEDFLTGKDSFRFPDSIILFEAWMNLGLQALYPRVVLHFKFPGLLKGEKTRHVFQFIYATSRGVGFPIHFSPEFYGYKIKYAKILEPFLKWSYTICHKINKGIYRFGDKRLKIKRHHPGEFESVIISEFHNNVFRGIDTLFHGYFTNDPKYLGKFSSLEETLQNVTFFYTIGDHAMSVVKQIANRTLKVPVISYEHIVKKYDVDFYSYLKKLMNIVRLLNKKIMFYRKKRKSQISQLKVMDLIKYRIESSKIKKIPGFKVSEKFSDLEKFDHYKHLMEKLRELLWTTPLYMHTIHDPKKSRKLIKQKLEELDDFEQESRESILLSYIKHYEKKQDFIFEEKEIIDELKNLRDHMAKMWLYFKERQYKYATKKLNELTSLKLEDENYKSKINEYLDKLIPIISIYEIFNRPLSESVYPESVPQTKRLGAHLARFITSKYNPIGLNIMRFFNHLAFNNWSYLIKKKKLSNKQFFDLILRLPIWKHIPAKVKMKILSYSS